MSPYKILGVTEQATDEEVKRAYLAMAAKYHPDAGGDAWVFAQVREAYDRILQSRRRGNSTKAQHSTEFNPYQPTQPAVSSDYTAKPTANTAETRSLSERLINLLFRHQLPLQSETSYFILVNVLDIVFTNVLLRMHAMEANPIANYILIYWGFPGMIVFKLFLVAFVCLITQLIAYHHLRRARQTLYFGTAVVSTVVAYSAFLLWRGHH
ncbi:MAG: DUF5658 family protein [Pirellulaceae bacterium]|nr:DUF5658 family protein [Pirellulaceae bacterium]